jgi:hypothetical protein
VRKIRGTDNYTAMATPNPRARVLVVGECNPFGDKPEYALAPLPRYSSGNRLRLIMGLSDEQYLRFLDRANLCSTRWSMAVARARADAICARMGADTSPQALIALGAKVGKVFGLEGLFSWHQFSCVSVICLPHPSGLCRVWSEADAVKRARDLLRAAAPWVPWGTAER